MNIFDKAALPPRTSDNPHRKDFFRPDPDDDDGGEVSIGSVLDHARALVVVSRDAISVFSEDEVRDGQIRSRALRVVLNDALEQLDEAMHALEDVHEWRPSDCALQAFLRKGGARWAPACCVSRTRIGQRGALMVGRRRSPRPGRTWRHSRRTR